MDAVLEFGYMAGIVLSLILFFYNQGYKTANRFLAAFLLFTSLFVYSQYLGLYSHSLYLTALFASSLTPFSFLMGPLFYLYVRSILRDNAKLSGYDYLHFLVFAVQFIGMIPYYLSSWEFKISIAQTILSNDWDIIHLNVNQIFKSPINNYFRPIYLIVYLVMTGRMFIKYYLKPDQLKVPLLQQKLINKWLKFILITFTLLLFTYFLLTVNLIIYNKNKIVFREKAGVYLLLISIEIVVLNTIPLLFPQILYGLPRVNSLKEVDPLKGPHQHTVEIVQESMPEKMETEIANKHTLQIDEKLKRLLQESQPWTAENFSISTLANDLEVPEHHLRYYFNHHLLISFPTYKNRLRVNHVKAIIEEGQHQHLILAGIGQMAGFSSKSSFFAVFKSETGLSPHEYKTQFQIN